MTTDSSVTVDQLASDRSLLPIDVRPFEERYDGMGFIPGSLGLPPQAPWAWLGYVASASPVVLVCMSGRRSAELVGEFAARGIAMQTLDGGVLEWASHGLPLAGSQSSKPAEIEAGLGQALRSCFVAQMAEMIAVSDLGDDIDPMALLEQCFTAEGVAMDDCQPRQLARVLDRAALFSRQIGSSQAVMAQNLDLFIPRLGLTA